ncbi:MAG: NAD(P)-binding protein [Enterobacter hormaechei]
MPIVPATNKKRLTVVGAGPAGLAFAVNAARGHSVTLFDALAEIGGQFTIARQIPGKEEFCETLRYYRRMIEVTASICGSIRLSRGGSDRFRRGDPREWDRPAPLRSRVSIIRRY